MVNPLSLLVASAFKNARENGYDFSGWSDEEITYDMRTCDNDIKEYSFEEILYYVKLQRS